MCLRIDNFNHEQVITIETIKFNNAIQQALQQPVHDTPTKYQSQFPNSTHNN